MWLPIASVSVKKRCCAFWFRPAKVLIAFSLLGFAARKAGVAGILSGGGWVGGGWNRKGARKRIKDEQIPTLLSTQLAHLLCIKSAALVCQKARGSSAQTLWVCAQRYGIQMPLWPPLSFIETAGLHICSHLCDAFAHLTSVATPLRVWRLSYITTLPHFPHVGVCLMRSNCVVI